MAMPPFGMPGGWVGNYVVDAGFGIASRLVLFLGPHRWRKHPAPTVAA